MEARRRKQLALWAILALIASFVSLVMLRQWANADTSVERMFTVLPAVLGSSLGIYLSWRFDPEVRAQRDVVAQKEKQLEDDATVANAIAVTLARERLLSVRAYSQARFGSWMATLLVFLAVSAPVVAAVVYAQQMALPASTVTALSKLKAAGINVTLDSASLNRDWRILLAGVSVGFLFIAGAASLLKQSTAAMQTYFRLGLRIERLESFTLALAITQIAEGRSNDKDSSRRVVGEIVMRLLHDRPGGSEEEGGGDTKTADSAVGADLIKLARDVAGKP